MSSTQTYVRRNATPQTIPVGSSYDSGTYPVQQNKYCLALLYSDVGGVLKVEQKNSSSNNWHVTDECMVKNGVPARLVSELVLEEVKVRYEMESQGPSTLELYTLLKGDR